MKAFLIFLFPLSILSADLNVAKTKDHPFVRPEGNRSEHRFTEEEVNTYRVYDFYSRQADYYMKEERVPAIVPAYPGLDAGEHGHWGKYNQNGHKDGRWNEMQDDGVFGGHIAFPKSSKLASIEGGIVVRLNEKDLYAIYSPRDLNVLLVWKGEKPKLDPFRWGTSRGMTIQESPLHIGVNQNLSEKSKYHGYYLHEGQAIFSYTHLGVQCLEKLHSIMNGKIFMRSFQFTNSAKSFELDLALASNIDTEKLGIYSKGNLEARYVEQSGKLRLKVKNIQEGDSLTISLPLSDEMHMIDLDWACLNLAQQIDGGPAQLKEYQYQTHGVVANKHDAYVVDDIEIPFENQQNSLMFFTGIDFDDKGYAYLSTLMGEVWKVSGLNESMHEIKWKKIASGLNQPFGLRIWDGKIYTLERTRISILHDLNGDDEIDFFENYNNQIPVRAKSHTHKFGLERDEKGDIYFINDTSICRVLKGGEVFETIATGVRNCMGVGRTLDGSMLFGPQEGTHTPTTAIIEVHEGEFYGHKGQGGESVAAPMCYIPRGVDGSVGGFFQVNDDRWGPLGKSIIGMSYGYGQWYQVLREPAGDRTQGATVPMPGEFFAGVVRAATNPVDGQVYVVGLDGWGDYSIKDGCFHRIRYTGRDLYQPIAYKVHHNGLQLDFPIKLDESYVKQSKHYFAQMWDYLSSKQYGSPEYSVSRPDELGHDVLEIGQVHLFNGGKSLFVEIPKIQPVMQMHLRMHLKSVDGFEFKSDIFPTIIKLGNYFSFSGAQAQDAKKQNVFHLRYLEGKTNTKMTTSGVKDDHARKIYVNAIAGMKYNVETIKAKAGESLAIVFENKDGMPHNFVIADIGQYQKVGMASFKMLNDPQAAKKQYVPEIPEVLASTNVIDPKGKHITYFKVPEKKGEYMFLCTFPGHWQLMKGKFIVE